MVRNNPVLDKKFLQVVGMCLADVAVVEVLIHPGLPIPKDSDRKQLFRSDSHDCNGGCTEKIAETKLWLLLLRY